MSIPLTACEVMRAIKGSKPAKKNVQDKLNQSHFLFCPCKCKPPCVHPTKKEIEKCFTEDPGFEVLIRRLAP